MPYPSAIAKEGMLLLLLLPLGSNLQAADHKAASEDVHPPAIKLTNLHGSSFQPPELNVASEVNQSKPMQLLASPKGLAAAAAALCCCSVALKSS